MQGHPVSSFGDHFATSSSARGSRPFPSLVSHRGLNKARITRLGFWWHNYGVNISGRLQEWCWQNFRFYMKALPSSSSKLGLKIPSLDAAGLRRSMNSTRGSLRKRALYRIYPTSIKTWGRVAQTQNLVGIRSWYLSNAA